MATSYSDCLALLYHTAQELESHQDGSKSIENVDLCEAVGRITASPCFSSCATPLHDTSAMDGFLVDSGVTSNASPISPVAFKVVGTIVPGLSPPRVVEKRQKGENICLEIMTGGRFPSSESQLSNLDACVPLEHVSVSSTLGSETKEAIKTIIVTRPVLSGAHRRLAGNDIVHGQLLVEGGQRLTATHIMPLASVGLQHITAMKRPRIGIWTTGSEFSRADLHAAPDVNGPFLEAACSEFGADASHLGHLPDDLKSLSQNIGDTTDAGGFDVLITTGAVSVGKFDFVRDALHSLSAEILFHGASIRPGHPVLFAKLPRRNHSKPIAFFGLPGNPGAAATCFKFLVVPYLGRLLGMPDEKPMQAYASHVNEQAIDIKRTSVIFRGKEGSDCFVPGLLSVTPTGHSTVRICNKTMPAKLEPFIRSNCWVHIRNGQDIIENQIVDCYPSSLAST